MIFAINEGHCLKGPDSGAEGCGKREQDLTRLVGRLVTAKLKAKGHTVIDCTVNSANSVNSALNTIVLMANIQKVDLFFSIHFNASDTLGHGVEIYTYGGKQMVQATNILKNICRLGYANRGIKDGRGLAVVRRPKAPSMLIECCFIDNKNDMALFNIEKMADAIVNGLLGSVVAINAPTQKNNYCLKWQNFYNEKTKTKNPIDCDGFYGESTQKSLDFLLGYIKHSKKYKYCLEWQRFYNKATDTRAPISEDGFYGPGTQKAYEKMNKLIKGEY